MTSITLLSDLSPEDLATLRGAWKFWGMDMQITIFEEELSELGEAITLAHIEKAHWSEKVFEELADVMVCFSQVEDQLRHFPTEEHTRTLWMDVEEHAAMTEVEGAGPDNLLLLHALKVIKAIAKTRRYHCGALIWNHDLFSELGGLLRAIRRTEDYFKGTAWITPYPAWDKVLTFRAVKLARLGMRLDEARKAEGGDD